MRVLVVDDHAVVREGLKSVLARMEGSLYVGEAANAVEALKFVRESNWDCALLDIGMPGKGGLELMKELLREQPDLRVLVLSMYPEEQYAAPTLRAGAAGFLNKESAAEQLLVAINTILRGEKYVSPHMATKIAFAVSSAKGTRPLKEELSDRELMVLLSIIRAAATPVGTSASAEIRRCGVRSPAASTFSRRLSVAARFGSARPAPMMSLLR